MENLAERLFCDLRNRRIRLENPLYTPDGYRMGDRGAIQIVLFGQKEKFSTQEGLTFNPDEVDKTFTESYNDLLTRVLNIGSTLRFYSLAIPKRGVVEVKLLEFENVVGRYIKDYLPLSDQILDRWDFLVSPMDKI